MTKVLIVDDEVGVADLLCNFLKRLGISSYKAIDGVSALEEYDKIKPDLVFLDIKIPGMDGLDVLSKLREKDPNAKVVMITGSDNEGDRQKAENLGAIDYIVKPIYLEELHTKIKTYIPNLNSK